jgi:hypothetical protein
MLDDRIQIVGRTVVIQDGLSIDFSPTGAVVPSKYIDPLLVKQLDQSSCIMTLRIPFQTMGNKQQS